MEVNIMGYANRLVHLDFTPELAEPGDTIWVTTRNPKQMTMDELRPRDVAMNPDGTPVDMKDATAAMYETLSKIIVGWHVYDAQLVLNPDGSPALKDDGTPVDQELLPLPATPELVAKLPALIVKRLSEELTNAVNPQ